MAGALNLPGDYLSSEPPRFSSCSSSFCHFHFRDALYDKHILLQSPRYTKSENMYVFVFMLWFWDIVFWRQILTFSRRFRELSLWEIFWGPQNKCSSQRRKLLLLMDRFFRSIKNALAFLLLLQVKFLSRHIRNINKWFLFSFLHIATKFRGEWIELAKFQFKF